MECAKIKDLLSEYIDGTLDEQTEALIDEHLLICPQCTEELASLKTLIRQLGLVESLKAPDDFLEKLHERLEPPISIRKIMRILFVPGKIKIPLEFATVTAMAVLIFSILYIQQPEKIIQDVPDPSPPATLREETLGDKARLGGKKPAYKSKSVLEKATVKQPAKKREIIELVLLIKNGESGKVYAQSEAVGREQAQRSKAERQIMARSAAPKDKMQIGTLKKDKQIAGLAKEEKSVFEGEPLSSSSSVHTTFTKVKELIRLVDGKISKIEYKPHTDFPQTILSEIPANNYEFFCDRLKRLAPLQNAPLTISENDKSTLKILIRLISS